MERERLAAVANLAGHPLSAADLAEVASILPDELDDGPQHEVAA